MSDVGFDGMWLPETQDPRLQRPPGRGERAVLTEHLDHYRTTLELQCDGLAPEELGRRSVPPSTLSLLGLVRHLSRVEHSWARRVTEAQPELSKLFEEEDAGFGFGKPTPGLVDGDEVEVRDVVVHLVEEYARHCGHADLLRECIDGRTGH